MGTPSTTPIRPAVAADVLRRAAKGFNDHDAHAFTSVMAPDVEFIHSALPEPMHGRAEVATTYSERFWQAFPDLSLELADGPFLHPSAPRAAVDWRVRGTHLGRLDPPGLAPTRRVFTTLAREILTIEDGMARRVHLVMDMADVMRQLGILPTSGSRGEAAMLALQRFRRLPRRRSRREV
jgi:predicted ester cyclase